MKFKSLCLLPALVCLSSCISIGTTPGGDIFKPENPGTNPNTPAINYFEGSGEEIVTTGQSHLISLRNDEINSTSKFTPETKADLLSKIKDTDAIISDITSFDGISLGCKGLMLEHRSLSKTSTIELKFTKEIQAVEITCASFYTMIRDNDTSENIFVSEQSAISINNKDKFVKVAKNSDGATAKKATFVNDNEDLTSLKIKVADYSLVIYELKIYEK